MQPPKAMYGIFECLPPPKTSMTTSSYTRHSWASLGFVQGSGDRCEGASVINIAGASFGSWVGFCFIYRGKDVRRENEDDFVHPSSLPSNSDFSPRPYIPVTFPAHESNLRLRIPNPGSIPVNTHKPHPHLTAYDDRRPLFHRTS
jgi:hypothetical protein